MSLKHGYWTVAWPEAQNILMTIFSVAQKKDAELLYDGTLKVRSSEKTVETFAIFYVSRLN